MQLKSRLVYQITCPGCQACYVGQTRRHLISRFKEHKNKNSAVGQHFRTCISSDVTLQNVKILAPSTGTIEHLLTLEALYLRDLSPDLNTEDEFRSRELVIKI